MSDSGGGMFRQLEPGRFSIEHPLVVNAKDGSVLVYVPSGEFEMGSAKGEGNADEWPRHRVELSAYWIGVYAVTNAQYLKFVEATGYWRSPDKSDAGTYAPAIWSGKRFPPEKAEHPVVSVAWEDAVAYGKWAGCELASEAQWERACRGPLGLAYPWGNAWDKAKCCHKLDDRTCRVYDFPGGASGYGTYNQSGNVLELCGDWYDKKYYDASPRKDPRGPEGDSDSFVRVYRGGSWWNDNPDSLRAAKRYGFNLNGCDGTRGLRLVTAAS